MHQTKKFEQIDQFLCLVCDEAFFATPEETLGCPKCCADDETSCAESKLSDANEPTLALNNLLKRDTLH